MLPLRFQATRIASDPTQRKSAIEEIVEAAQKSNRGAHGVQRVDGVVLGETRIAEEVAGGAPKREEPDGESSERRQIVGRIFGPGRIAVQHHDEDQRQQRAGFLRKH